MASSESKIAHGIARSVTGAPCGRLAMTNLHASPASLTIASPRKSPRRRATVIAVDFWLLVLAERLRHRLGLRDELEQLLVLQVDALRVEHVDPLVGDGRDGRVARLEVVAVEEGRRLLAVAEDLRLEDLDQLELAAPLDLEALELGELAVLLEDRVPLLEQLALLERRGQDHRLVRPVDLEEDRLLALLVVLARLGVEPLVLRVVVVAVDVDVEHDARVRDGHLGLRRVARREGVVLREGVREDAPDAVGVELERLADLLDERARLLDDRRAGVGDDARHLHRVPPRALPHDVAVEGVEDALVRELQRVVEHAHRLRLDQPPPSPAFSAAPFFLPHTLLSFLYS